MSAPSTVTYRSTASRNNASFEPKAAYRLGEPIPIAAIRSSHGRDPLFAWGISHTASVTLSQVRVTLAGSSAPAFAMMMNISAANLGIAVGAFEGGWLINLAKTHTVIAIDLPGLGQSEAPKSYLGQDVGKLTHKFAKSHSAGKQFDLISHDIGNWVTFPMVAESQADFKHVVFMEAPLPDEGLYTFPSFTPQGESPMWHFSFFAAGDNLAETMVAGREAKFFEYFITSHAANKAAFTPELLGLSARSYAKPHSFRSAMEYYRALPETQRRNVPLFKNKLTMKTMAIGGGSPVSVGQFQVDQLAKYATNEGRCDPELRTLGT